MMKSILITGCNRGIGLALVKQLSQAENPPRYIIGTYRNIQQAKELQELKDQHQNLHLLQIDLTNFDAYEKFAKDIESIVQSDGLNVLFNNAGISSKFTRLPMVKVNQLTEAFTTNTVAPIILTKTLLPLLKVAAAKNPDKVGISKAAVINMSSVLGSITENTSGGFYPYRCAKSALNAATKSMSVDLNADNILVAALHPGWVKTDMGGPNAPLDVNTAVTKIIDTLKNLNESHNGQFLQYDGKILPW